MQDRSSTKRPRDVNQLAKFIVDLVTADDKSEEPAIDAKPEKNQAAVTLGRLGGLKGGKARAESMTKEERSAVAKRAADARWRKPA